MRIPRRQFLKTSALAVAASTLPFAYTHAAAREGFTALRRGVGTYEGRGGTIGWLVSDDALVVVDTQFPDSAQTCLEGLQERSGRSIDLLINTHHHGDHTAGNGVFRPHAKQHLAHENVPKLQQAAAERAGNTEGIVTPEQTYSDVISVDLGDETVMLHYYGPAHTSGDSVVHFVKADIVHMGDLMFNRMPAFIDVPGGASTRGWITLLETVHGAFTDETRFIYGHGNASYGITGGRADLLVMRDFLGGLIAYVEKGIQAGQSLEEMAAIDRLPDFPEHYRESWQGAIPRCIRTVHGEVTAEQ